MKLAEALVERKALKDEIQDLRRRLQRVAKVQEGDEPVEEPLAILRTIESKLGELEQLITRINRTNIAARLSDDRTLMEAIAERDMLRLQRAIRSHSKCGRNPEECRSSGQALSQARCRAPGAQLGDGARRVVTSN